MSAGSGGLLWRHAIALGDRVAKVRTVSDAKTGCGPLLVDQKRATSYPPRAIPPQSQKHCRPSCQVSVLVRTYLLPHALVDEFGVGKQ